MSKIFYKLANYLSFGRLSYLEQSVILIKKENEELKEQVHNAKEWQKVFEPVIKKGLEAEMNETFNSIK